MSIFLFPLPLPPPTVRKKRREEGMKCGEEEGGVKLHFGGQEQFPSTATGHKKEDMGQKTEMNVSLRSDDDDGGGMT